MKTIIDFHPAQEKTYGEWATHCPECGGNDRFIIWTDKPNGGKYFCRHCRISGDGIAFLMNFEGMGYLEACNALELTPDPKERQMHQQARPKPDLSTPPPQEWMQQAAAFVAGCQNNLDCPEAQRTLADRYITKQTALALGIGWNDLDRFMLRSEWGLPDVGGRTKLLWPKGLVMGTRRKIGTVALTIRCTNDRPKNRPRYWQGVGGQNIPFVVGKADAPLFIFESLLDAVLLWQETQGQYAAVALMGSTKAIDDATANFIRSAPLVIACPDDDEAGHKAWAEWRKAFPLAVRYRPLGKDLTEMHSLAIKGGNAPTVAQWADITLKLAQTPQQTAPPPQNIDFHALSIEAICSDPALIQGYRQHFGFDKEETKPDIFCLKNGRVGWRSKRDCIGCAGDKYCYLPIVGNPFEAVIQ